MQNKEETLGFFSSSTQPQPITISSPIKIRFYAQWFQIEKFAPRIEDWLKTIGGLEVLPSIEVDEFYRIPDAALPLTDIAVLFMTEILATRESQLDQFTKYTSHVRAKASKTFVINLSAFSGSEARKVVYEKSIPNLTVEIAKPNIYKDFSLIPEEQIKTVFNCIEKFILQFKNPEDTPSATCDSNQI